MKPWVKGTSEGRLYVDTKHPEWKKWFVEQIEKYSKLNILKKAPSMSGEQKTFEDAVKEYMIKQGIHDRPDITEHDFRQGWIACESEQSAALKESLAELIPIAENFESKSGIDYTSVIERAKKLLKALP